MRLATLTLKAISDAIEFDQGGSFRQWEGRILPHIHDAYQGANEGFRTHLGASLIGKHCPRELWYGFRWCRKPKFKAQTLRLFNRGHLEEGRFIAMLQCAGMTVVQQDEHGKQFRISEAGGHFGGSGDGLIYNCPDLPVGAVAVAEFKTHNDKSFKELVKTGVKVAKFQHYVQMQCYMRKMGYSYAVYMAVNKNTDELHAEIVVIDDPVAEQYLDRGIAIVFAEDPPKKCSESSAYFECKFCDYKDICHYTAKPDVTCRSCQFASPNSNGEWVCSRYNSAIPKNVQLTACNGYLLKRGI